MGRLLGASLTETAASADYIPTGGGPDTKVATEQKNKASQLVFLVPAGLGVGTYYLEVRARIRGGTDLRIGRLPIPWQRAM